MITGDILGADTRLGACVGPEIVGATVVGDRVGIDTMGNIAILTVFFSLSKPPVSTATYKKLS